MDISLERKFLYHLRPEGANHYKCVDIGVNALTLAEVISKKCPDGREKSLALTKLEEAVMWANESIARNT